MLARMRVALLVALACACGKHGSSGGGSGDLVADDSVDCATRTHALEHYFASIDRDFDPLFELGVQLVTRDDIAPHPPTDSAPVLEVRASGLALDGKVVALGELGDALAAKRHEREDRIASHQISMRGASRFDPARVFVAIDQRAAWRDVVAALRASADAGGVHVVLAFARTPKGSPPPPHPIDAELAALLARRDPSAASELAKMVQKVIERCKPLAAAYGSVAADEPDDKAETLLRATWPSLVECDCAVDLPAFRSMMYSVMVNRHPKTFLALTLDDAAPALELPAATTWQDAQKQITAATARAHFVAM